MLEECLKTATSQESMNVNDENYLTISAINYDVKHSFPKIEMLRYIILLFYWYTLLNLKNYKDR